MPSDRDKFLNCRDFSLDDTSLQEAEQRRSKEAQAQAQKIREFFAKKAGRQYSTVLGEGTPHLVKEIRSSTSLTAKISSSVDASDLSQLAIGASEEPELVLGTDLSPSGKHLRTMSFPMGVLLGNGGGNGSGSGSGGQLHHTSSISSSSFSPKAEHQALSSRKIRIHNGHSPTSEWVTVEFNFGSKESPTIEIVIHKALAEMEAQNIKRPPSNSHKRHSLFVNRQGIEQRLSPDDRPLQIQSKWLQELGYCLNEDENIGLDFDFYFRFWIGPFSPFQFASDPWKNHEGTASAAEFDLAGKNLYSIPVWLLLLSKGLLGVDLGRNRMIDLSADFCQSCDSLQSFGFSGNTIDTLPYNMNYFAKTLSILDLGQNCLREEGLERIGEFVELSQLRLRCNRLKGLPKGLSNCKKLKILDISNNFFQKFPDCLLELGSSLVEIDASYNYIAEIPSEINQLTSLERLNLSSNLLKALPSSLVSVTRGSFDANLIVECKIEANYSDLITFSARHNHQLEDFSIVSQCSQLAFLRLEHCTALSRVNFTSSLPTLCSLSLAGCKINHLPEDIFQNTPNLKYLDISYNFLIQLPSSIDTLEKLQILNASCNQISRWTLSHALPNLQRLELHQNNLVVLPHCLWSCPRLEWVNISSNSFSTLPLQQNEVLSLLRELRAAENKLLDESICSLFEGWANILQLLNLSFNERMIHIHSLGLLKNLKFLFLSGIGLGSVPEGLGTLNKLEELYLNLNQITSVPYELKECKSLKTIDLSFNRLKYNLSNSLFDWNWTLNPDLEYLAVCQGNSQLTISKAFQAESMPSLKWTDLPTVTQDYLSFSEQLGVAQSGTSLESQFSIDTGAKAYALFSGNPEISHCLSSKFLEIWKQISTEEKSDSPDYHVSALRKTFLEANRALALSTPTLSLTEDASGTFLLQVQDRIFCANVGNALAVMCRDGKAMLVACDHSTWNNAHEIWRIKTAGGFIDSEDGSVCSALGLSKSFGYISHLPFTTACPSIYDWNIEHGRDDFVIKTSPNLWEVVDYQLAVDIVWKWREDLPVAAHRLRDYALAYLPRDSVSSVAVVIISLSTQPFYSSCSLQLQLPTGSMHKRNSSPSPPSSNRPVMDVALARLDSEISPPMGNVCIVFTDIKGSTKLWSALANSMKSALKIHNQIIRRLLRTIGGYEVKTEGDAFMVVFPSPLLAFKWCLLVQSELLAAPWSSDLLQVEGGAEGHCPTSGTLLYRGIGVRMGIHVGVPFCELDPVTLRMDYFGLNVTIAARIRDLADGGQIFCTAPIKEAVQAADKFFPPPAFFPLGTRTLKGISEAEAIFAAYPQTLAARHHRDRGIVIQSLCPHALNLPSP